MEQLCCGISRWGQVKEQLDFPAFRRRCAQLLEPIVDQTEDFIRNGYRVCGVIGLDGSPSCGVNETCSGRWGGEIGDGYGLEEKIPTLHPVSGSGVMMEVLHMHTLTGNISGYAVPKFVIDAPGGGGKIPVGYDYVLSRNDREVILENYRGELCRYPQPNRSDG